MQKTQGDPVYVGLRSVYESGNSYVVTIPKEEVEQDLEGAEIVGNHRTVLTDDGKFTVDFGD